MKKIAEFEQALDACDISEKGINTTAFWAYVNSINAKNDIIDFHDVIWERDVDEIVSVFEWYGITEFTISCTFTSLLEKIREFEKRGFKMDGLVEVNAQYTNWKGEREKIPAVHLSRVF